MGSDERDSDPRRAPHVSSPLSVSMAGWIPRASSRSSDDQALVLAVEPKRRLGGLGVARDVGQRLGNHSHPGLGTDIRVRLPLPIPGHGKAR
jgi:hypothetical protein